MILILILIFSLIISALIRISPFHFLQNISLILHQKALQLLPQKTAYLPELKALTWGDGFQSIDQSKIYLASGLIHLFVISGAHLQILKKICNLPIYLFFLSIRLNHRIELAIKLLFQISLLILLFIYAAACLFNPPVTRSWLFIFLDFLLKRISVHWSSAYQIFIVGLLTLMFNPAWVTSLSLQLSWLITLALYINQVYFSEKSKLIQNFLCFLFIFPIVMFFQQINPIVILIGLCLTPFLEFILFPLALSVVFFNDLAFYFDSTLKYLRQLLELLELPYTPSQLTFTSTIIIFNWLLIFTLHFIIWIYQQHQAKQGNSDEIYIEA